MWLEVEKDRKGEMGKEKMPFSQEEWITEKSPCYFRVLRYKERFTQQRVLHHQRCGDSSLPNCRVQTGKSCRKTLFKRKMTNKAGR